MVGAAALKISSGLALPFLLVGARERRAALRGTLVAGAVAIPATLLVFGPHVLHMVRRIASEKTFDVAGSVPDIAGRLLGVGVSSGVRLAAECTFVLVAGWQLWRAWRGANWLVCAGWATLALLLTLASLTPWYTAWLLPLAALAPSTRLRWAALVFTVFVVVTRLPALGFFPSP